MEPRNRAGPNKQDPGWQVVDGRPKKSGSKSSIWSKMTGWLDKVDNKLTGPSSNGRNGKVNVDNVAYKPQTNNLVQSEIIGSKNPLPKPK